MHRSLFSTLVVAFVTESQLYALNLPSSNGCIVFRAGALHARVRATAGPVQCVRSGRERLQRAESKARKRRCDRIRLPSTNGLDRVFFSSSRKTKRRLKEDRIKTSTSQSQGVSNTQALKNSEWGAAVVNCKNGTIRSLLPLIIHRLIPLENLFLLESLMTLE